MTTTCVLYVPHQDRIDDLALQANELLSSAVEAQKSIATNNTKVTALEQFTESYEVQMAQAWWTTSPSSSRTS